MAFHYVRLGWDAKKQGVWNKVAGTAVVDDSLKQL